MNTSNLRSAKALSFAALAALAATAAIACSAPSESEDETGSGLSQGPDASELTAYQGNYDCRHTDTLPSVHLGFRLKVLVNATGSRATMSFGSALNTDGGYGAPVDFSEISMYPEHEVLFETPQGGSAPIDYLAPSVATRRLNAWRYASPSAQDLPPMVDDHVYSSLRVGYMTGRHYSEPYDVCRWDGRTRPCSYAYHYELQADKQRIIGKAWPGGGNATPYPFECHKVQ